MSTFTSRFSFVAPLKKISPHRSPVPARRVNRIRLVGVPSAINRPLDVTSMVAFCARYTDVPAWIVSVAPLLICNVPLT